MISKVCRLAWDYPVAGESTFGLEPVFVNLSQEQANRGYEVHVISRRSGAEPAEEMSRGVRVHRVAGPFSLNSIKIMRRLLGSGEGWVVHSHATCGFHLAGLKYSRHFPLVSQVHLTSYSTSGMSQDVDGAVRVRRPTFSSSISGFRERLLWASADRVLAVSNAVGNDVVRFYGIKRDSIRVVYNGVDTELFRPQAPARPPAGLEHLDGKRIILFVGSFRMVKGIPWLVRAMRLIRKDVPDAHLLCVGGSPKWLGKKNDHWNMLAQEIERNDLRDCVTLQGAVRNNELPAYYSFAEMLVLPSFYEAFSKVVLEAMACGKPVVATRAGGNPEAVEDDVTGKLVPYGSAEALASAIVALLDDSKRAASMGRASRLRAETIFSWHAVGDRVAGVYNEVSP